MYARFYAKPGLSIYEGVLHLDCAPFERGAASRYFFMVDGTPIGVSSPSRKGGTAVGCQLLVLMDRVCLKYLLEVGIEHGNSFFLPTAIHQLEHSQKLFPRNLSCLMSANATSRARIEEDVLVFYFVPACLEAYARKYEDAAVLM